jgi:hypothetical protein
VFVRVCVCLCDFSCSIWNSLIFRIEVDFSWRNFNHLRGLIKEVTLTMQVRDLHVVLWAKINHSPNHKQWKMAKNPVSWWSLKIGATKKNFIRWKPKHSVTPEHWIFVELSHAGSALVCVVAKSYCECIGVCVVSKYFLFLCLLNELFQRMEVSTLPRHL